MKAGILTFYNADSYGAVLQAYALEQAVIAQGAQCELVNIAMPQKNDAQKTNVFSGAAGSAAAAAIFAKKMQLEANKRKALFEQFRSEHLKISKEYSQKDDIAADYDVFIAGSDQIWNFAIPDTDARYFLPFARKGQRFSYAASFGGNMPPEKVSAWCAKQLEQFESISVREPGGCEIVKKLTGKDSVVSLDPTFLPEKEHWYGLTEKEENSHVLLFMLKYDEKLHRRAEEEAARRGLPLKAVTAGFMPKMGMEAWNGTGVIAWLNAIRNAAAVYTNSFHGMVFSIIFERELHAALLGGELAGRNDRIIELLGKAGLSECLNEGGSEPDYEAAWKAIEPLRQQSLDYLRSVVEVKGE